VNFNFHPALIYMSFILGEVLRWNPAIRVWKPMTVLYEMTMRLAYSIIRTSIYIPLAPSTLSQGIT
jgi:hypothetical protein